MFKAGTHRVEFLNLKTVNEFHAEITQVLQKYSCIDGLRFAAISWQTEVENTHNSELI